MNLSQLRAALARTGVRPSKSLGQNFLHDQNLARWIVQQAQVSATDFVIEIGPGLGALTQEILARGARVLAIEKDRRLVDFLRERFRDMQFEVVHGDALHFDQRPIFAEKDVKIVGNLPYYIASQLLIRYVDYPTPIRLGVLMLQDEMARRLSAVPRTPEYGSLTLRVQLHHQVRYLRKVPNTVFFPEPEVSSAILRVTPRSEIDVGIVDDRSFHKLVRRGFSQRRKQLRNLLNVTTGQWEFLAAELEIELTARAEELSREQWIALSNLFAQNNGNRGNQRLDEQFTVVDENDHEVASASRSKVHENNFRHRAVHIFIFNKAEELLLQKRSRWKDRHPLLWDSSAAGHVAAGERYDDTANRELAEELGIRSELEPIGKIAASEQTGQEFIWLYRGMHEGPFDFAVQEISAVQFFPVQVVDRWTRSKPADFAPGFLECWKLWQADRLRRR